MNFVSQVNFSINNSPFAADFTTKISSLAENNIASATLAGQHTLMPANDVVNNSARNVGNSRIQESAISQLILDGK